MAWVTALTDRYRYNPTFRSAVAIMSLKIVLAFATAGVFVFAIQYSQDRTVETMTTQISAALAGGATTTIASLPDAIDAVRDRTVLFAFFVVILLNLLSAYLVGGLALKPAREAISSQKRFIGNIAHEIRTPLAIIKTSTEVALFDPKLPSDIRATMQDTLTELDRISETINNLLSFDALTRPRTIVREPVDVAKVVETVVSRHEALARSRGVELIARIEAAGTTLGNATALDQAVTNLVKNAINYTPGDRGGSVTVTLARQDSAKLAITVADTGIGIAQKDLYRIFEPFYRGDTSRARGIGTGSSGLGLAIVNEIVRMHNGAVSIRSAPDRGTSITITLPCVKESELPNPLAEEDADMNEVSLDFS